MNPAMIAVWTFGLLMVMAGAIDWSRFWPWGKALLVIAMTAFHMLLAAWRQQLAAGQNRRSGRDFRIANEIPTIIMILIVILVIAKPF
ncbi:MAG TPA: CopD family protein, partial [Paracoccaceae bacterium]|nr:CopD family protein [Paracoccaceae bacterium]